MGMNVGGGGSETDPMLDINMTPLIDVMLVLLIMFIVTIPIIEFEGDDFARGTWRQETFIKENNPDLPGTGITYCTAHDTYRRHDKGWRIESVRVTIDLPL